MLGSQDDKEFRGKLQVTVRTEQTLDVGEPRKVVAQSPCESFKEERINYIKHYRKIEKNKD